MTAAGATDSIIKSAIYGIGEHLFQHRGVVDSTGFQNLPYTVRAIVGNYQKGSA